MAAIRGVNLSGWLVLESWITPSVFAESGTFDQAALLNKLGREEYDRTVAAHRDSFITERDFKAIASRGYNAVRLGVPWHVFGNEGPLPGSHEGCIAYVDRAFQWAEDTGLSVLLDLSLAPGSEISADGLRMSLELTPSRRNAILAIASALASRYASSPAFLGIEPLDEVISQRRTGLLSLTEGAPLASIRRLYRDLYEQIRAIAGPEPIIVFSDAGQPDAWKHFMARDQYENVWLDTHPYRHMDRLDAQGPSGARMLAARSDAQLERASASGLPVMVGEWSAALPVASSQMTGAGRIALERIYVSSQLAAYDDCAAWFFQTWKTEGKLAGWDARVALSSFEREMLD